MVWVLKIILFNCVFGFFIDGVFFFFYHETGLWKLLKFLDLL